MADDLTQGAGICNSNSGAWWSTLMRTSSLDGAVVSAPPVSCSTELMSSSGGAIFNWPALATDMAVEPNSRSSADSPAGSLSASSVTFQDPAVVTAPIMDSTTHLLGFGLSSPLTSNWSHPGLLSSAGTARAATGFQALFQEDLINSRAYLHHHEQLEPTNQLNHLGAGGIPSPNQMMEYPGHEEYSLQLHQEQQHHFLPAASGGSEFPLHQTPFGSPSTLFIRSLLLDPDALPFPAAPATLVPQLLNQPSPVKQPAALFSGGAAFWSATAPSASTDVAAASSAGLYASAMPGHDVAGRNAPELQLDCTNPAATLKPAALEGVGDSSSVVMRKGDGQPPFKKPRIGMPSPLPTFKVRKEKLGDRITALQQLVSPFGKTDTASVLHETIEYIKFLHDQVGVLSAPYLKNGHQMLHLKGPERSKDSHGSKRELGSRGLCLVPISSTYAVAGEVPIDFWTPPFGRSLLR